MYSLASSLTCSNDSTARNRARMASLYGFNSDPTEERLTMRPWWARTRGRKYSFIYVG